MDLEAIYAKMREIAKERDWEQFHTPKNLVMALNGEVGELTELFQWLTPDQSAGIMASSQAEAIRDEIADVLYYLLRLTDKLQIDLEQAFWHKLEKSLQKYPVELARGHAKKYTDLLKK